MDDQYETAGNRSTLGACAATRSENTSEGPLASIDRRLQTLGGNLEEIARRLNAHADRVHGASPEAPNARGKDELVDRPDGALRRVFETVENLERTLEKVAVASDRNITLA